MAKWEFKERTPGDVITDPVQGEFFTHQDVCDRLIRESIQNSLDEVKSDEQTATVIINLKMKNAPGSEIGEKYFQSYYPHLKSSLEAANFAGKEVDSDQVLALLGGESPMTYLTIEDFGTKGLTGNVHQFNDSEDESAVGNNFFWFVRNIARTGKKHSGLGSWGLGKWVFPDASIINAFFLYTVRDEPTDVIDGGKALMMGSATLYDHSFVPSDSVNDGRKSFVPYGFFANMADNGLQLPLDSSEQTALDDVCKDFMLSRKPDQTGLSIIIPFPHKEVEYESLVKAAVDYYFYPMLCEDLKVVISDDDEKVILDGHSLPRVIDQFDWGSEMRPLLDLARQLKRSHLAPFDSVISRHSIIHGDMPKGFKTPEMKDRFSEERLKELRERFMNEETMVFKIPVKVKQKREKESRNSHFMICLKKDSEMDKTQDYYIRDKLTIPDISVNTRVPVRSLLLVDDEPLRDLLRDSEEPSHSDWKPGSDLIRNKYNLGFSTVQFVKNSVRHLTDLLTAIPEEVLEDLLSDVFSIPLSGNKRTGVVVRTPKKSDPAFNIHKVKGGIRVSFSNSFEVGQYVDIEVAYDVKNSPFTKYDPKDFDISEPPIALDLGGVDDNRDPDNHGFFTILAPNHLRLYNVYEGMSISLTGFDPNRDIIGRIRPGTGS